MDTKEKIAPGRKGTSSIKRWILAFVIPFAAVFAVGFWMEWTEEQEDTDRGRIFSDLGRELTVQERLYGASYMGMILGVAAGGLGLIGRGGYVLFNRAKNRTSA